MTARTELPINSFSIDLGMGFTACPDGAPANIVDACAATLAMEGHLHGWFDREGILRLPASSSTAPGDPGDVDALLDLAAT